MVLNGQVRGNQCKMGKSKSQTPASPSLKDNRSDWELNLTEGIRFKCSSIVLGLKTQGFSFLMENIKYFNLCKHSKIYFRKEGSAWGGSSSAC